MSKDRSAPDIAARDKNRELKKKCREAVFAAEREVVSCSRAKGYMQKDVANIARLDGYDYTVDPGYINRVFKFVNGETDVTASFPLNLLPSMARRLAGKSVQQLLLGTDRAILPDKETNCLLSVFHSLPDARRRAVCRYFAQSTEKDARILPDQVASDRLNMWVDDHSERYFRSLVRYTNLLFSIFEQWRSGECTLTIQNFLLTCVTLGNVSPDYFLLRDYSALGVAITFDDGTTAPADKIDVQLLSLYLTAVRKDQLRIFSGIMKYYIKG